jgi:hypothetical protein
MVWEAIGPHGFRNRLIRCPPSVNGAPDTEMIYESGIIELFDRMIDFKQYRWQQDSASAHRLSRESSGFPAKMGLTDWPAKILICHQSNTSGLI